MLIRYRHSLSVKVSALCAPPSDVKVSDTAGPSLCQILQKKVVTRVNSRKISAPAACQWMQRNVKLPEPRAVRPSALRSPCQNLEAPCQSVKLKRRRVKVSNFCRSWGPYITIPPLVGSLVEFARSIPSARSNDTTGMTGTRGPVHGASVQHAAASLLLLPPLPLLRNPVIHHDRACCRHVVAVVALSGQRDVLMAGLHNGIGQAVILRSE